MAVVATIIWLDMKLVDGALWGPSRRRSSRRHETGLAGPQGAGPLGAAGQGPEGPAGPGFGRDVHLTCLPDLQDVHWYTAVRRVRGRSSTPSAVKATPPKWTFRQSGGSSPPWPGMCWWSITSVLQDDRHNAQLHEALPLTAR